MSLVLAAKHLESQGRGNDSHLVHMTSGELQSLRGLAKAHGGDITINPKTGLPEAGFLSSILPTVLGVAGAAMGIPTPLLIGGIGLAATALTGDITQGLMAGLGAWSGAGLASKIGEVGAAQTVADASKTGAAVGDVVQQAPLQATNAAVNTNVGSSLMGANALPTANTTTGLANIGSAGTSTGGISGFFGGTNPAVSVGTEALQGRTAAEAAQIANKASPALLDPNAPINFKAGFNKITSSPGEAWQFTKDNPFTVAGAAYPFVNELLKPPTYKPEEKEKNPFGLKYLSKDFKGSFPEQPSPAYQAQYRDYVANPYIPGAADGGLQTANYARGDLVKYGLSLLDNKQDAAPITATDPGTAYSPAYNAVGIHEYEKGNETLSPDERAEYLMKSLFGKKQASRKVGSLGALSLDPAIVAQQAIESERAKAKTENSKEGGLQGYALGGLSMGHLGGYSDGGRLLKGPGDGVSDSIPASIGAKQPARLAEGEFVIPARIVSEIGNGSTDAGAKRLYAMMDRIKAKRAKTKNIAADSKAYKYLPA
jgi:hypothetical protein